MRHGFSVGVGLVMVVGFLLSACNPVACGPGTHEAHGECVPSEQTLCGEGTVYVLGYCVIDDGSASILRNTPDIIEDTRDVDEEKD